MNAHSRPVAGERGVSVVEMLVVLFLMSIVGLMFFQLFTGTLRTTVMLESQADLTYLGQRAVNDIRSDLMQSRTVFQDNALGQAYEASLLMTGAPAPLTGGKLPIVDVNGEIEPESAGDNLVGNRILMARQLNPEQVNVDHDSDGSTPNVDFLVDLYRFEYVYLAQRNERDFAGNGYYLDLVRAQSPVYADYFQLSGLNATLRGALQSALISRGVTTAWDPGQLPNNAFYSMTSAGGLTLQATHQIDMSSAESMLPELAGGRISGKMTYSVGVEGTSVTSGDVPVSVLAESASLFPSGFETLVVGASGSRKVFLRLVLMSEHSGKISGHANEVVISNADF